MDAILWPRFEHKKGKAGSLFDKPYPLILSSLLWIYYLPHGILW
jgi:hypothetical protein